ncbi:MAG: glutamine--tRNA ligase/YqeY domain fusion protein [Candidatus Omnitrophica bacterium]|nr:glutamine--tRNA ligase/YqeY domain fusion protein [Candidatus Omnitrophota bacterium]
MEEKKETKNFIREIIDKDLETGKYEGRVHTRFPPEPNGYLHIGHAKSICLNFGLAKDYSGKCNLRMDDTNPEKEDIEYVNSIQDNIKWLGFNWNGETLFASDYYDKLYDHAIALIKKGKAYVCDLSQEKVREYRGTVKAPGKNSPNRDRSIEENLDLFMRMKNGEFADGAKTLRAKIDMTSQHMIMRDPPLYRIKRYDHFRTGSKWCIYPMYDFAHCLSDSAEGITHSICTMEFENNRVLYDWVLDALELYHPQQIEFARLNLSYTVLSKRKLLTLVNDKHVSGWDDPRMPTLSGLRRRGYTPEAIRIFCDKIGVARFNSIIDVVLLENSIREQLNKEVLRVMGVLEPLKVVITNYPEDKEETVEAINNPEDENGGTRKVPFSRELYIEREDFKIDPPKKFFRLSPGKEVRLRYAYYVTCTDVLTDDKTGEITEIHCTYDPATKGGDSPDGRKVKATLHWVSAKHAYKCKVRLYDHLFIKRDPNEVEEGKDFISNLNPNSLQMIDNAFLEPSIKDALPGTRYQFERKGYFFVDPVDSKPGQPVFNRVASLRDSWAKIEQSQ